MDHFRSGEVDHFQSGRSMITEENEDVIDPDDRAAWIAATEEFERLEPAERAATL